MSIDRFSGKIRLGNSLRNESGGFPVSIENHDADPSNSTRHEQEIGTGTAGEQAFLETLPMLVQFEDDGPEFADFGRTWSEQHPRTDGTITPGYGKSNDDVFPTLDINQRRDVPTGRRFLGVQSKILGEESHLVDYQPPGIVVQGTNITDSFLVTLTFGANPQAIEIARAYINLPQQHTDRTYRATGKITCTATIDGKTFPPVGDRLQARLVIAHQAFDADSTGAEPEIGSNAALVWDCDRTKTNTLTIPGQVVTIPDITISKATMTVTGGGGGTVVYPGETISLSGTTPDQNVEVPVTAGIMSGSATVTTIFNSDTVDDSAAPSSPEFGVFKDAKATLVSLWLFVYADGYTGDVLVSIEGDADTSCGLPNPTSIDTGEDGATVREFTVPYLEVMQLNFAADSKQPEPTPPPPPPPPPPPAPSILRSYISVTSDAETWTFDGAVDVSIVNDGMAVVNTFAVNRQPFRTSLNLAPGDYTATAALRSDASPVTLFSGSPFTVASADDSFTITLEGP